MDIDDLSKYLESGLTRDTLKEMDLGDLHDLSARLDHWAEVADRVYRNRKALSIEEGSE